MTYTTLFIEQTRPGCATIQLNRPQVRNALNGDMIDELTQAVKQCQEDLAVRVIILTGQGGYFCAGADINSMKTAATYTYDQNIKEAQRLALLFRTIDLCPKPTVAVVEGGAFGGGLGLLAVCDVVIAHEETIFSLSEVRLGLVPGVISPYLVKAIGARQSQRLTLTAERFSAKEALHLGLVHRTFATDNPLDNKEKIVGFYLDQLLKGSPQAQTRVKQLFRDIVQTENNDARRHITTTAIAEARASSEGKEGLQAFLEKRLPTWILEEK